MATYKPLQSVALTAATASVTFSGIDQGYNDLIIVVNTACTSDDNSVSLRFNSDTGSNYSVTAMRGNGSAASSVRGTSTSSIAIAKDSCPTTTLGEHNLICHVNNYVNSTTYKTTLSRANRTVAGTYTGAEATVGLWRSTAAITSLTLFVSTTFAAGSTFDLYGIKSGAPQALGGDTVVTDGNYWYHAFKTTGAFTPLRTLSCDYLIVAGGGGSGGNVGAGGGAGGVRAFSSQTLNAANYTVTVGAGGAAGGGSAGSAASGTNTSFNNTSVTGGGYGGNATAGGPQQGANGGSGGGSTVGNTTTTGGTGNAGGYSPVEGYAGAGNTGFPTYFVGGGGGGASAVGVSAGAAGGGAGGAGTDTYNSINFSSWLTATSTGASTKVGGGGGGGGYTPNVAGSGGVGGGGAGSPDSVAGNAGAANTGGGAGGGGSSYAAGAAGGSGLVIVRYAV